jgi:hypothetical protein
MRALPQLVIASLARFETNRVEDEKRARIAPAVSVFEACPLL